MSYDEHTTDIDTVIKYVKQLEEFDNEEKASIAIYLLSYSESIEIDVELVEGVFYPMPYYQIVLTNTKDDEFYLCFNKGIDTDYLSLNEMLPEPQFL